MGRSGGRRHVTWFDAATRPRESDAEDRNERVVEVERARVRRPTEPAASPPMEERFVVLGGKRVRYLIGGEGKPLVLCHGFISSGEEFGGRFAALAGQRTLIAPDLPGNGQSDPLSARHSAEAMAGSGLGPARPPRRPQLRPGRALPGRVGRLRHGPRPRGRRRPPDPAHPAARRGADPGPVPLAGAHPRLPGALAHGGLAQPAARGQRPVQAAGHRGQGRRPSHRRRQLPQPAPRQPSRRSGVARTTPSAARTWTWSGAAPGRP